MNIKNLAATLLLAFGLIACSQEKGSPAGEVEEGIPTYVNLTISLPGVKSQTRALPEDYNPDGEYEGNDFVQTLDIYMLDSNGTTIEAKRFSGTDISSDGTTVSPSQPFRTTSGSKTVYVVLNDPNPLETSIDSENQLVPVDGLARTTTVNGVEYDLIAMTGKTAAPVDILPDIPVQEVANGTNHIEIEVTRVASRVIVTTTAPLQLTNSEGAVLGTLSNLTYSVAQGASQIYWLPQPDFTTFGSDYVPSLSVGYIGQANQYYDYSDLSNPTPIPARPAAGDGYKSLEGKFLFENTHTAGDIRTTEYRKGNTAYVLVKCVLTPLPSAIADGGTLTNGTFYYGVSDGNIYSSLQAAQNAQQNQKVQVYQGGEMLYYAWLNPDDIAAPLNSPVLRNNIYHINITGFTRVGNDWNPLYPENPGSPTPTNPDPRPSNPYEPENPINPLDPLTPEQTYMTVEVSVLNWYAHSYDIEF